ncbi:MAG TPA: Uma2 family endonuclease [Nostocaceae cyanobacterium]|nr:Uma2 family endonuclease [Nostocaceae cyanobacterium]
MMQVKRFSLAEYHQLIELGFFRESDRLELISGEIMEKAPQSKPHATCLRKLMREFPTLVSNKATLQTHAPISVPPNSEPEPDFAIIKNREDNYLSSHPTPADVLLLIEVADYSLEYDQKVKLPLYAQAGITDYWIINLLDNYLECYSNPSPTQLGKFGYLTKRIVLPTQVIALPCFPDLSLDLTKIFLPRK